MPVCGSRQDNSTPSDPTKTIGILKQHMGCKQGFNLSAIEFQENIGDGIFLVYWVVC